jgi:hypothetical protein
MTINCNQLDDLLLEGELETAARHAQTCDACLQKLADWNEITDTARAMQAEWNSDLLWPRIERALDVERRASARRKGAPPPPSAASHLWRIAASLAVFLSLASLVWFANHRTRQAEFDNAIIRSSRLDEVQKAEQAHLAAIDQLEKLAEPKLDAPATPILVSYKEKLMMLDDAIAECQANIDHNRQNAYLRKQLAAVYSEKQRTLQDVLREENHVQNHVENR